MIYEGGRKYRGMFIVGELQNPDFPEYKCLGAREYAGKVLNVVDRSLISARWAIR